MTVAATPPPLTWSTVATTWQFDVTAVLTVLTLAAGYAVGARRLRRRGHGWPRGRTLAWASGLVVIAVATLGALGAYDRLLFWPDMAQHIALGLLAPVLLAFAMPVALAARVLRPAIQRRLQQALRSRTLAVAANPVLSFAVLMALFVIPYPSGAYAVALDQPLLHDGWHVALLVVGLLFAIPLIGLDPVPGRVPHLLRQGLLLASLPIYVVVGLAALNSDTVFAADYFARLDRGWGPSLAADQDLGGAVFAWAGNGAVDPARSCPAHRLDAR